MAEDHKQGGNPRAGSGDEGVQSYRAPAGRDVEEKAPSSIGDPEPEHVAASLHPQRKTKKSKGKHG